MIKCDAWRIGTMVVVVLVSLLVGMLVGALMTLKARAQASPMNITFNPVMLHGKPTGASGADLGSRMGAYCDSLGNLLYVANVGVAMAVVPGGCR